jgi:hypothetical protein
MKFMAGLALAAATVAAQAQEAAPATPAAAYQAAGGRFATLVAAAEAADSPALLQGGEGAQLVAELADAPRFLEGRAWDVPQLGELLDLCARSNQAVTALAQFELKSRVDPKAAPQKQEAQAAALFERNARTFAAELAQLQPFLIRCETAEVAPMTRFVAGLKPEQLTDARRQGVVQFRGGLAELFGGVLRGAADERYDEAYRRAVLEALARGAPELAGAMQVAQRQALWPEAEAARKAVPEDFGPALSAVTAALRDVRCEGLCGY